MYTYSIQKKSDTGKCYYTIHLKSFFYNYIRYTWLGRDAETLSAYFNKAFFTGRTADWVRKGCRDPDRMHHCCLTPHMAFNFTEMLETIPTIKKNWWVPFSWADRQYTPPAASGWNRSFIKKLYRSSVTLPQGDIRCGDRWFLTASQRWV